MPANKSAMTRYALLDRLLSNQHRAYSIQDMTDYLKEKLPEYGLSPVTRRQVEKDINYLEYDSPFDVELVRFKVPAPTASGRGSYMKPCIRYADPEFSIFKKPLSDDELSLLSSVLSTLGSFRGQPNFEWLDALASKLNVEERPAVICMSKNISENSTLLAELFVAISSCSPVRITYRKFVDDRAKRVVLSPYMLKEYNCRWYLLGSPADSDIVLNFALDRIEGMEYAPEAVFCPCKVDLAERYEDIIGITYFEKMPIETITFWVGRDSVPYVDTKPLHGSMRHLPQDVADELREKYPALPDGEFYSIECKLNYELIRELTVYGANLIVLSPGHIAETVYDQAVKLADRYRTVLPKEMLT